MAKKRPKKSGKIGIGGHGSTCPNCFTRVTGKTLGEYTKARDKHDNFCRAHPETWSPDRDKLPAVEIIYLCGAAASLCNGRNDFSEAAVVKALREAGPRFGAKIDQVSDGTMKWLARVVLNILGRMTGMEGGEA